MQTHKQALLAAYRHEKPDFIPNSNAGNAVFRCPTDRYMGEGTQGRDMFGVKWILTQAENRWAGMSPAPDECLLDDIADWRDIKFPDLDSINWPEHVAASLNGVDRNEKTVTALISSGLFERMNQLMGMENALCAFYEDPDSVKEFFEALADFKLKCIDYVAEYGRPDIIQMHDDWGMSTNMFFSPDIWREFIKPHEERFARRIHSHGAFYEHHSCGYITPIIGDLVEIGVDALNPLNVCNDLQHIKNEYGGKITLVGGFDNQRIETERPSGAELDKMVRSTFEVLAPGGSFVSYYVPLSEEMCQAVTSSALRTGKDFYNK